MISEFMLKNIKLYKFYEQVKQEVGKVSWPSRKEVVTSTAIVLASVVVFSLCCLFVDFCIHKFVQLMLNIGKN